MNYELAKKLRDAGFPVKKGTKFSWTGKETIFFDGETNDDHQRIYFEAPALSELIEACGDGFRWIQKCAGWWEACANENNIENTQGSTPEEAIANLWLELNKK